MALLTYTATSVSPLQVYPAGQQESVLVRNTETLNHVYLSNLASGVGFDLGPGSSMIWAQGNPLYVSVLDSTLPATVTVLDNGGDLFDASAIAAQISISGAPPIDAPEIFFNGDADGGGVDYDVTRYQSLFISVAGMLPVSTDQLSVRVTQYIDDSGIPLQTDVWSTYGASSRIDLVVPVKGITAVVDVFENGGSIITPNLATLRVVGSYRSSPVKGKIFPGDVMGSSANVTVESPITGAVGDMDSCFWTWTTVNASQNRVDYPAYKTGPVVVNFRLNSPVTTGTCVVIVADGASGLALGSATMVAGDQHERFELIAPASSLKITMSTNSTFAPIGNSLFVALASTP